MSEPTHSSMRDASDVGDAKGQSAGSPSPQPTRRPGAGWRSKALLPMVLASVLTITVLVVLVGRNGSRAEDWQRRSKQQSGSIAELQRVLGTRSSELNFRIRQVNKLTASVRRSQTALGRSESDVSSLAYRQRQLADEKAQVEDERAQLEVESNSLASIAGAFLDCNDGLNDLLSKVLGGDRAGASQIYDAVVSDCQIADDELSAYQNRYG